MSSIKAFKALIYNKKKIPDISKVVAPPYDVIPPKMQEELYRRHPYNVVRLILGKINKTDSPNDNRYTRSGKFFRELIEKDILTQIEVPAIFIYSQRYKEGAKEVERLGFIALMEIDLGPGKSILAHENTLAAPKTDRLNLMRTVKANLSPIFVLYDDSNHAIVKMMKKFRTGVRPLIDVKFDNVRNIVWQLDDPAIIKKIGDIMRKKDIFIADGHHRYETARNYALESQSEDAKYLMSYFVESDEKMLTVLPAHRLVRDIGILRKADIKIKLGKFFTVEKVKNLNKLMSRLNSLRNDHVFGIYLGKGDFCILKLKNIKDPDAVIADKPKAWRRLDVSILHNFLIEHVLGMRDDDDNIEFVKDPKETAHFVDSGKFKIAFFLNPTKVSQVKEIAKLGARMPRKATYFYPKPISGLVINKLG